jgi:hypothetical protein
MTMLPLQVNAGADQTICNLNTTIGNPGCAVLANGTFSWSVSGPSTVTFADPNANVTNVSFSTAGIYTFTLTADYGGSCIVTDEVLVNVTTPSVIATASPASICPDAFSTLTASGATSYSWSPGGATTASITVSPTTTTTYTVVGITGTCSSSTTVTVTVKPTPIITVNSPSTCVAESTTLTASGGLFYVWSGFGPGSGTITVAPTTTTTYTVTGVVMGCSATATATVTVDQNCCGGSIIISPGNDVTGSGGLPTSFAGTTIAVNSNLTIGGTSPTNFNNCILLFAPGKAIVIPSGKTLIISKSSLYSCGTQMWFGIQIQPGGNLIMQDKSLIEDAYYAVFSDNSTGTANFHLEKTTFNRNYIGVEVANYSGGVHPGKMIDCTFDSQSSVTTTSNTAFLDSPFNTQTAQCGVELNAVNSIQIGDASSPANQNRFRYLRIGIHADKSEYVSVNNDFRNNFSTPPCVAPHGGPPCPLVGWAIWNIGTKATIGGYAPNQANNFQDLSNGIYHEKGYYLDVFKNTFKNIVSPVTVNSIAIYTSGFIYFTSTDGIINISSNSMENVETGLYHFGNPRARYTVNNNLFKNFSIKAIRSTQNLEGSIELSTNTLTQSGSGTYSGKTGIDIGNAVYPLGPLNVSIGNNTITYTDKGILVTDLNKPNISGNTITFKSSITPLSTDFYYGIRSQNSQSENISQNTVTKGGANPTSGYENSVYGISVETNNTSVSVLENQTTKLGTGLRFRSYSNASSRIRCNLMTNNFSGLGLDYVQIGDQGGLPNDASDNNWSNPSLIPSSVSVRGTPGLTPYDFYTRASGYPWCPTAASIVLTGSIHNFNTLPSVPLVPSAPTNCNNICIAPYPPCTHAPTQAKIVRNESPFNMETGTQRYNMHEAILRGVLTDSIPLDTTTIDGHDLQMFVDSTLSNSNVGKLVNVSVMYKNGDTLGAISLNASISPKECADDYHKIVNEIFFHTWGIGDFNINSHDSTILYDIAIQDPLNCGTAIYDARVMMNIDVNDYTPPGHAVQNLETSVSSNAILDKVGILYPNPAQNLCTYEAMLTDSQTGFIMMYDLNGRLLQSHQLIAGQNKADMNLSVFNNGVYMYKIIINGETIEHKKLVISK